MFTAPASLSSADSSIVSVFPAIALSDVKRPWPSDVPPPTERRLIAAITSAFTLLGCRTVTALSPNATTPIRIELGCRSTKAVAAAFAAVDPCRLEILGAHAVRDVEGEDHRALPLRHREAHGRAREREADERECRREERERDVASPADRRPAAVGTSPSDASRAARSARRRSRPHVREHQGGDAGEAEQHPRRRERHQRRRHLRDSTIRTSDADEVVRGRYLADVDAGAEGQRTQLRLAVLAGLAKTTTELGVARVDHELLAGLRVLDHDHAGVGKLVLARVEQPDRDDLVALGQLEQGPLPSGRGDEVGDEDDERASPDRAVRGSRSACEVGDRPVRPGRPQQAPGEGEHLVSAAARRDRLLDLVVEEDRPDPVAAAGEQPGERRRELAQDELLRPVDRAEPHRRRPVEQQPGRELAILGVLPDERRVHPRGDVPVDVPDVVAGLVLAEVEEVRADPAERRAVVPLEQAVEAADHLPLEAAEEPLGRLGARVRVRSIASLGVRRRPGSCAP